MYAKVPLRSSFVSIQMKRGSSSSDGKKMARLNSGFGGSANSWIVVHMSLWADRSPRWHHSEQYLIVWQPEHIKSAFRAQKVHNFRKASDMVDDQLSENNNFLQKLSRQQLGIYRDVYDLLQSAGEVKGVL